MLVKKGSGHWTARTYRPEDGVLTAIKTGPTSGATTIQNLSFAYDGLGNLTSRSGSGGTETLSYDVLNRLVTTKQGAITYFDNGNIKKKPDASGTQPTADFGYDATHPHAVATGWGYAMGYDANGNLISRTKSGESWSFRYAGFDKPRWMAKTVGSTTAGSEFLYNANRSRTVQLEFDAISGGVPSHYVRKRLYALGSTLEINYDNQAASGTPSWALKKVRIYVPGPEGVIGAREFDPAAATGSQEKALVYHYDHLGSIESITPFGSTAAGVYASDSSGKSGRYSEDAWGQRRDPLDWSGPAPASTDDGGADSLTPRGFTGHEMLDDLGLVHMNGRIYDPLLGRMLSADIVVQAPGNLQAYNRYSYVMNNPATYTDPTGFFWKELWAGFREGFVRNANAQADASARNLAGSGDVPEFAQKQLDKNRADYEGIRDANTANGIAEDDTVRQVGAVIGENAGPITEVLTEGGAMAAFSYRGRPASNRNNAQIASRQASRAASGADHEESQSVEGEAPRASGQGTVSQAQANRVSNNNPAPVQTVATGPASAQDAGPRLFSNRLPLQDPVNANRLVVVNGKYKIQMPNGSLRTPTGSMNFVTMPDGRILVHKSAGHTGISQGRDVAFAGQVQFSGSGVIKQWDNGSGHYQPPASAASQAGLPIDRFMPHPEVAASTP